MPSLELAYSRLQPLFFAALGNLARQGFLVSPADSMDLIHDFFAEAWTGLESRFDPDKGSFESYTYGAFIRFARPRIVRLRRWQDCLIGTEELDSFAAKPDEKIDSADRERVQQVLAKLPESEQDILRRYLYSDHASERALAKELGVSRYRLREILVDALGRMAVSFDRPSLIAPQDWKVARALWGDGRTVLEAAAVLQITPQQVRSAYQRNVRFLTEALKHYHPHKWSPERTKKMAAQRPLNLALDVLKKALHSPDNKELLEDVRSHADKILQALEATDTPPIEQQDLENLSQEWVADVYQAIFQGAGEDLQADVEAAEATEAHEEEDTAIGRAFRETLLAGLPNDLKYPLAIRSLPEISKDEQARLERAPDVDAGKPESKWWLNHGIRPVTVFYAIESVSDLLDRYLLSGRLAKAPVVLGDESLVVMGGEKKNYPLSSLLKEEISCRAECSDQVASGLYSWMLQVAQRKPWLFAGFRAEAGPGGRTVRLTRSQENFDQIYQRWGLTSLKPGASARLSTAD